MASAGHTSNARISDLGVPGLATLAGVVLLVAITAPRVVKWVRRRSSALTDQQEKMRPIPEWAIWIGLILLVLVGVIMAWVLVSTFGSGSAQDKIRLEAIKLAGSIAVGTGGAAALLLAARKQRATELGLQQQEQTQRLQEQRAADSRHDADERRVTELYTAAAQQLASESAPVRLAGLYTLERLGQTNPKHRQTIVNLFCAYLRMPYTPPEVGETPEGAAPQAPRSASSQQDRFPQPLLLDLAPSLAEAAGLSSDATDQQQQELQVRLTAQRLLAHHLRSKLNKKIQSSNKDFWPKMDIDLTGATLCKWDFSDCSAHHSNFSYAQFYDSPKFDGAQFHDMVHFDYARFHGYVHFIGTRFRKPAWFGHTHFPKGASFNGTKFYDWAWFIDAHFHERATFDSTEFRDLTWFYEVEFHNSARFNEAQFNDTALFYDALFHNGVKFEKYWARIDLEYPSEPLDPAQLPGWTLREGDPGDGRDGHWGELVPEKDFESKEVAPTTADTEDRAPASE